MRLTRRGLASPLPAAPPRAGTAATGATCRGAAPRDPYHILVSEIMLQQTQVERVRAQVPRVPRSLPDARARWPARAPADVRRLWYPLGYNVRPAEPARASRARRWRSYGGRLPDDARRAPRACAASAATPRAPCCASPTAGTRADRGHQRAPGARPRVPGPAAAWRGCGARRRCGISPRRCCRARPRLRLQPGAHGLRRHLVHRAGAPLPPLPDEALLRELPREAPGATEGRWARLTARSRSWRAAAPASAGPSPSASRAEGARVAVFGRRAGAAAARSASAIARRRRARAGDRRRRGRRGGRGRAWWRRPAPSRGGVDVLVNSAAVRAQRAARPRSAPPTSREVLRINLVGAFVLTKHGDRAHARARRRQHRPHRLGARHRGRAGLLALRRLQGRAQRARPGRRRRAGPGRDPRQRGGARHHRHRDQHGRERVPAAHAQAPHPDRARRVTWTTSRPRASTSRRTPRGT